MSEQKSVKKHFDLSGIWIETKQIPVSWEGCITYIGTCNTPQSLVGHSLPHVIGQWAGQWSQGGELYPPCASFTTMSFDLTGLVL